MKEYIVKKRYSNLDDIEDTNEIDFSDELDNSDEFERFYVEKITEKDSNRDITTLVDTQLEFEDDYDLTEYLAQVFDEDPDEIEIIEDETTIEYSSPRGASNPSKG